MCAYTFMYLGLHNYKIYECMHTSMLKILLLATLIVRVTRIT